MTTARNLDASTVHAIRKVAFYERDQFTVHVCDVWLSGQAADGTSVEYAAVVLGNIAASASFMSFGMRWTNTATATKFSKMTRLSDRARHDRWQCRAIDMSADDGKSATVTITVDGTTGGVVNLAWDQSTNRWELVGTAPDDWASRGLLQLAREELAVCAKVAVEFANWR
jgi:hypothetical protein